MPARASQHAASPSCCRTNVELLHFCGSSPRLRIEPPKPPIDLLRPVAGPFQRRNNPAAGQLYFRSRSGETQPPPSLPSEDGEAKRGGSRKDPRCRGVCSLEMEPDGLPLDPVSAAALVVRAIDDIDESADEERNALLADLLCAAWGSPGAKDQ